MVAVCLAQIGLRVRLLLRMLIKILFTDPNVIVEFGGDLGNCCSSHPFEILLFETKILSIRIDF